MTVISPQIGGRHDPQHTMKIRWWVRSVDPPPNFRENFKNNFYPELFTNQFFTVNTGRHKKLSFAAVFSYKQNNQKFICRGTKTCE
jgi:hypothetical protein